MLRQIIQTTQDMIVEFVSTRQYNTAYRRIMGEDNTEDVFDYENMRGSGSIAASSVKSMYYHETDIQGEDLNQLVVVFEKREPLSLLISGNNRAKHAYGAVKLLLNKPYTNKVISIAQDNGKYGIFRHDEKIIELHLITRKVEQPQVING